ncbi:MAG: PsbP-related protein [Patescibacteria group bacterium]
MKKLLLIIVLVAVIGGLYWKLGSPTSKTENIMSTPSVDTAGWQTYRNEELGFEFKYPSAQSVVERDLVGEFQADLMMPTDEDRQGAGSRTFLVRYDEGGQSCVNHQGSGAKEIAGVSFNYSEEFAGGMQSKGVLRYYTAQHNGRCYGITLWVRAPRHYGSEKDGSGDPLGRTGPTPELNFEQEFPLLEAILSTFRFTK